MFSGSLRFRAVRAVQMAVLCCAAVVMLGAGGQSRFDRIGHGMICTCGCTQILLECNHVGCPVSPVMIGELQQQLAAGGPDNLIFNWFVAKYGAIVLASPTRGGFDDVAWIAPISVFILATLGTALVVWVWKRRSGRGGGSGGGMGGGLGALAGVGAVRDDALRERIRRETEY